MLTLTTLPLIGHGARFRQARMLPLLALLLCSPLLWQGGGLAVLGALAIAGCVLWDVPSLSDSDAQATAKPSPSMSARRGPEYMISQLIPIWSRQMNATRAQTGDGVENLLQAFNAMGADLSNLASDAGSGAGHSAHDVDAVMASARPAIDILRQSAEQAMALARHTQDRLVRCAELAQSHKLACNRLRSIARHTRLVAFNAAIEGRRGQGAGNAGFITLAEEVKLVSAQLEEAADGGDALSAALDAATAHARVEATLEAGHAAVLPDVVDAQVREAIALILQSMGSQARSSSAWRGRAECLKQQIDEIYVQFQFGDRVSQMIELISTNMSSFVQWVSAHPHPTQADVDQWLEDLDRSYSMEEQRAYHHGNVHVSASQGIEFF